jgi:hypothetical protein
MREDIVMEGAYTDWMAKTGGYAKDMTLRDHFAGLAMQGMLMKSTAYEVIAQYAYIMADAMLKERSK